MKNKKNIKPAVSAYAEEIQSIYKSRIGVMKKNVKENASAIKNIFKLIKNMGEVVRTGEPVKTDVLCEKCKYSFRECTNCDGCPMQKDGYCICFEKPDGIPCKDFMPLDYSGGSPE